MNYEIGTIILTLKTRNFEVGNQMLWYFDTLVLGKWEIGTIKYEIGNFEM